MKNNCVHTYILDFWLQYELFMRILAIHFHLLALKFEHFIVFKLQNNLKMLIDYEKIQTF